MLERAKKGPSLRISRGGTRVLRFVRARAASKVPYDTYFIGPALNRPK